MPEIGDVIVGVVLNLGVFIAFAPQIIKILRTKTSFGVSALNVLFGMAGNGVAVVNALITYFSDLECCWASSISFVQCIELNLPLIQLWLPFMMSVILVISFAYYCDPVEPEFPAHTALRIKHFTWAALGLSMLVVLICVLVPFSLFYETTTAISVLYSYRDAAGYVAAALASVQFLPQIAQTLQLRRPGSLSIISLLVMLIGNFAVFSYLYFLNGAAFSTVFQNLITGSEQLFLLASIAYFRVSDGPFGHDSGVTTIATTDDAASRQPSETQPLLINQQQLIQEPRDD